MTDLLYPDHWSTDTCYTFSISWIVVVAILVALSITYIRRKRKGFAGFDFAAFVTVVWLIALASYFATTGISIAAKGSTASPMYVFVAKTFVAVASVVFAVAIKRDKRVFVAANVPPLPPNVIPRRRRGDMD